MGDFTKVSNYNPQANFNMVRFGADTPITEYELNEVQQIQQNVLKTALVNTIGNGFIKSGNLIDSGTSITLSNSVVHLNGKVFEIDSLTSTLNEGETIYLDVFTKTISKTDSIKNLGNQQTSTTVTNYLQDTRLLGIETARREQVCYNLVKTTGVANHDYLIVCKRENGEFKDLRPLGNLNDYKETVEGSHISTESSTGVIQDLEILGNTVQDVDNLADIKSVGELQEDGTYKMSILSTNGLDKGNQSYQENKCDILLPCQLEKVGDVSDRLYYDDVEKAWCIEKNIKDFTIPYNTNWNNYSAGLGETLLCASASILPKDMSSIVNSNIQSYLSNRVAKNIGNSVSVNASEGLFLRTDLGTLYIKGLKSVFNSVTELGKSIEGSIIKYQLATPQKIVLPLDVQISLNSFFGTTHVYMESGEVEGTIKCKIPKSLGATVQSLNNKTDILSDRIEAIEGLKDSQNMKYETDKGYLVCKETKNGVIDDLKIEGKTLVNLAKQPTGNGKVNGVYTAVSETTYNIKPLTEYTYIIKNNGQELVDLYLNNQNCFPWTRLQISSGDTLISKATSIAEIKGKVWLSVGVAQTMEQNLQVVLLEGDHTQNPPSYFEGLMSVGQDVDEIEVLSCNEGNMVDLSNIVEGYYIGKTNVKTKESNSFYCNYLVKITPSMKITLRNTGDKQIGIFRYFDQNESFISGEEVASNSYLTIPKNARYLGISFYNRLNIKDNLYVGVSSIFNNNRHQSDKKQILFYNENGELEPIQELHEWDSIEKHSDNKWYYHKRSGKVVLNGSENWRLDVNYTSPNCLVFTSDILLGSIIDTSGNNFNLICDRFIVDRVYETTKDNEGIIVSGSETLWIKLNNSKLSTQDVQGFKQWLQANNVTVVYQLAKEEVYGLAPLHLDSYEGETLVLCNSGAISPRMEFKIHNNIGNVVRVLQDRVNKSEEFIKTFNNESSKAENKPYETENGVIEFEGREGYTDNVYIEGETLVNLAITSTSNATNDRNRVECNNIEGCSNFTVFNYMSDIDLKVDICKDGVYVRTEVVNRKSKRYIQVNSGEYLGTYCYLEPSESDSTSLALFKKSILILEGDYTDKNLSYFGGVVSVGQTNEMRLYNFAYEEHNQVDLSNVTWTKNSYVSVYDFTKQSLEGVNESEYVKVEPNTAYLVKNGNANIPQYDVNKNPIKLGLPYTIINGGSLAENNSDLIYFTTSPETHYVKLTNVTLTEKSFKVFEGVKMDIKQIPTTLRSVNANIKDLIVKQGTKYYKYMKCAERVLTDTTPNLAIGDSTKTNTISFIFDSIMTQGFLSKGPTTNDSVANFLNDRFPMYSTNDLTNSDKEGIALGVGKSILVRINKARLATLDVAGFRTWLKNNAIHLIYEIETPAFVELSNFNVQLFKGVNNLAFVSKGIAKDISFEVTQSKDNELILLKQQVADLSNLVNTILGCKPVGNNSIHLRGNPLPMNENARTQPRISFADGGNDQAVQLRYNSYDVDYKPFGLNVEKVDDTTSQPHLKAFLSVEGELITRQGRLVLGSTNDITKNEIVSVTSDGASKTIMTTYPHDKNGQAIRIGAGGLTVIGGGESPDKYMNELPDVSTLGDEKLILTADHEIVVRAGAQNTFTDNCKSVFHNTGGLTLGSSNGNVKRTTISSAYPSGGANGDVWFRYE